MQIQGQSLQEKMQVCSLYENLLKSWNDHNADNYANLFTMDGCVIGFDGSQMMGRSEINKEINNVFAYHKVASYISIMVLYDL
jgi:uncharacterized protein (TIGR02246 family)